MSTILFFTHKPRRPLSLSSVWICSRNGRFGKFDKKILLKIKALQLDAVFLDLGAGSSKDMVDFFSIADFKLLVTTSEPTALMNNF